MKFMIQRVSDYSGQPCKEAVQETYTHVDERTFKTPDKLPRGAEDWYSQGSNHRVENGHIKRDFVRQAWFIEIADLDHLLRFQDEFGDLVLCWFYGNEDIRMLEIYDGYRE